MTTRWCDTGVTAGEMHLTSPPLPPKQVTTAIATWCCDGEDTMLKKALTVGATAIVAILASGGVAQASVDEAPAALFAAPAQPADPEAPAPDDDAESTSEADPTSEPESDSTSDTESDATTDSESDATTDSESDATTDTESDSTTDTESDSTTDTESDPTTEPESETSPEEDELEQVEPAPAPVEPAPAPGPLGLIQSLLSSLFG